MSAYATARSERTNPPISLVSSASGTGGLPILDAFIEDIAERVAGAVIARLSASQDGEIAEWLDSQRAAAHLGVHRDALRQLAAERTIPEILFKTPMAIAIVDSDRPAVRMSRTTAARSSGVIPSSRRPPKRGKRWLFTAFR